MRLLTLLIILSGINILSLSGCSDLSLNVDNIALVQSSQDVANHDFLVEVAKAFYKNHPDEYDMLVLWSAPELAPGHSYYFPVKNDVPGIGYENAGTEFFDDSAEFGSQRLQGIVWMGPDWINNPDTSAGPRSNLGILAQETGHRFAATVHFADSTNTTSSAFLEDTYHWNFYFNTGASPMGGNQWDSLGNSLYQALPADYVEYCPLDLYLMGLLQASDVEPLQLLVNVQSAELTDTKLLTAIKTSQPITVQADILEISIDQIIAAEGPRDPDVGFNAKNIRQAWIYVYNNPTEVSHPGLNNLVKLQKQWDDYFSQATNGLSVMSTSLVN